jgi:hypothetical protein
MISFPAETIEYEQTFDGLETSDSYQKTTTFTGISFHSLQCGEPVTRSWGCSGHTGTGGRTDKIISIRIELTESLTMWVLYYDLTAM